MSTSEHIQRLYKMKNKWTKMDEKILNFSLYLCLVCLILLKYSKLRVK